MDEPYTCSHQPPHMVHLETEESDEVRFDCDPDCYVPPESVVLARVAALTATEKEREEARKYWDQLPEWRKRDIEDEVELGLL